MLASTGIVLRESSAKNDGSVIIYSPPCCSKPVELSFVEHKRWIFAENLFQLIESKWKLGLSSSKMTKSTIKDVHTSHAPYFKSSETIRLLLLCLLSVSLGTFLGLKASVPFIRIVWKSTSSKSKHNIQNASFLFHRIVEVFNNKRVSN